MLDTKINVSEELEGWDLCNNLESGLYEIACSDANPIFSSDALALAFVKQQAAGGSARHQHALALHLTPFAVPAATQPNPVSQVVKQIMLTYPNSFKSRMDVLKSIFIDGGCWALNDAGAPDLTSYGPLATEMHFTDLEQLARPEMSAGQTVALKRRFMERRFIEANIDVLASEHCNGEQNPSDDKITANTRLTYSFLEEIEIQLLDRDWALAAEEDIDAALCGLSVKLGRHSPRYKEETADKYLLQTVAHLQGWLDRLDLLTGSKERRAEIERLSDALIEEVLSEECNRQSSRPQNGIGFSSRTHTVS